MSQTDVEANGPESLLMIGNFGGEIQTTNFWQSEYEKRGLFFFSVNQGACRLLVPKHEPGDEFHEILGETNLIEICIGYSVKHQQKLLHIMFLDETERPYCLTIGEHQFDFMPKPGDPWDFTVWVEQREHGISKPRKIASFPCSVIKADKVH